MNRKVYGVQCLACLAVPALLAAPQAVNGQSEVLYDTLFIVDDNIMDGGVGNAIGGDEFLSLGVIDSQVADDFEIDRDFKITRIVRDYMSGLGFEPEEGIWVQIYADENGTPSEDVFAETVVSPDQFESIDLGDIIGFQGWRFDIDLTDAGIELPAGKWWLDLQPLDVDTNGDWFWSIRSINTLIDGPIHVRDGWEEHGNNYTGLWGSADWIPLDFRGNGSLSMRIEGEPTVAGCLELSIDQLVGGETTRFTIADGTTGQRAVLVWGFALGETVVNGQGGFCATFGIDGVSRSRVLGGLNNTFDANGEMVIEQFIPGAAQGRTVHFQAAERGTCPDECVSNVLSETVQ